MRLRDLDIFELLIISTIIGVCLIAYCSYSTKIKTPSGEFDGLFYSCVNGLLIGIEGAGNILDKDGYPLTCEVVK